VILLNFCADCLSRFHAHSTALALVTLCSDCGAKLAQVGRLMTGALHMGLMEHDGKGGVPELDRDPVGVVISVEDDKDDDRSAGDKVPKKMVAMEIGFSDHGPVEKSTMPPRTARHISRQLAEAAISAEKGLKFRVALKIGQKGSIR